MRPGTCCAAKRTCCASTRSPGTSGSTSGQCGRRGCSASTSRRHCLREWAGSRPWAWRTSLGRTAAALDGQKSSQQREFNFFKPNLVGTSPAT
eukprot:1829839-Lingulodinium_polyedra.AAC.1